MRSAAASVSGRQHSSAANAGRRWAGMGVTGNGGNPDGTASVAGAEARAPRVSPGLPCGAGLGITGTGLCVQDRPMVMTISDSGAIHRPLLRQEPPAPPAQPPQCLAPRQGGYRPEPAFHPQIQAPGANTAQAPSAAGGQYGIPNGSTLGATASGTRAQPFDVTLSQLATAVYGTRGDPPEGWSAVADADLAERIGTPERPASPEQVQAWRLQYLGANDSVPGNDQEFRAEVYSDGEGNYVLSYRGTAEGADDWDNNFRQGLGYETRDGDKFSVTAVNTAREFAQVFGDNPGGESTNLAITGHSQGGGLASVGALASGVPAVTFDASGIHPNTFDRIGIDPQRARDVAEGGQIRAYSLSGDALTRAQDSWATGLVAPDAVGTRIVVAPTSADEHNMFSNYGPMEGFSPEQSRLINAGVEVGRHTPFLPLNPVAGLVTGGANLAGTLGYAGISHSPNALTAGMIEHQPWQAGYENPTSLGRELQDLLPGELKDDYARNTHDFATDIDGVVANQFANGQYVAGAFSIAGDFAEGFLNSTGDTVDRYADALAAKIDDRVDGWAGDLLSGAVNVGGNAVEFVANGTGQVVEVLADGAGKVAQGVTDFVGGLFGR
ncbi:DUF2974 domain-containing protein [Luteimonas yindakuii]|uniref:DUF2974 domain-containing protein n=2 Tax=Luteimonas yindakuii TaxID=2565782 RepID=A0A4Z1R125_9GAMM|nr:DUF2974 domain-containing protein [Luteimonas yindakuii]